MCHRMVYYNIGSKAINGLTSYQVLCHGDSKEEVQALWYLRPAAEQEAASKPEDWSKHAATMHTKRSWHI